MNVTKNVAVDMDLMPILSTKYRVIRRNFFEENNDRDEEI